MDRLGIDLAERDEMDRIARLVFRPDLSVLLLIFSLAGTTSFAQESVLQRRQMGIWEARRTIAQLAVGSADAHFQFSTDSFEFGPKPLNPKKARETFKIDLLTAPAVKAACDGSGCRIADEAGRPFPKDSGLGKLFSARWTNSVSKHAGCSDVCLNQVNGYADAFNVLRNYAQNPTAPLRTFSELAGAWRALATKPPVPEEVREHRLLAEESVKEKNLSLALDHYEMGICLYPTWPEGNFNAALIAAELNFYPDAIEHMQAYLELVPDAPDAQAARDNIVIWKSKLTQ
jgi:tetratricopeptide (TPR) repeat protein